MKRCVICDELKDLNEFHKAKDRPDGYRGDCKDCRKNKKSCDYNSVQLRCSVCGILKDRNEENFYPTTKSIYGFRRGCKECAKNNMRKSHLKRKYDITPEEYDELFKKQEGKCAICKENCRMVVDHNHNTGVVRGLLCDGCNTGIGGLKESVEVLLSSIKYLKKHNT